MKLSFFVFFLLSHLCLQDLLAQNGQYSMGARSAALGGASLTISDSWALFNNIGGLAGYEETAVFTSLKNKYAIAELTSFALGATFPIVGGMAGIGAFRFGNAFYNEQRVNLGFSNEFGIVSLGLNAGYYQLTIETQGNRKTLLIDFGGRAEITQNLVFGAQVSNANQARLSKLTDERIPTLMKTGISYRPTKDLMINIEVEKELDRDTQLKTGLEYQIIKDLALRTGFRTQPFESSFGMGFRPGKLLVDYAYSNNPNLGAIHEFSLGFTIKD